ncbi:MAG: YraN family protein [Planctomycetota bacterium]
MGERGERLAQRYLQRLGYQVVDRRVRGPLGELDIVAVQDRTIVFVEVKTRRSHAKGSPLEAVGETKQRRIARLALSWLKRHHLLHQPARFDVVGITWPHDDDRPRIRHVRNAFSPPGRWQLFS